MKDLNDKRPGGRQALTFTVEGKAFETFDQYKTGAELKQLAGIPLETELFLAVVEGYDPELIGNDDKVDLAREDVEHFYVKDKLKFTINDEPFTWYLQYISGKQIRDLGKIPEQDELFLKVAPPYEDELITADREVDLALPGFEHFYSSPVERTITLIVSGVRKSWDRKKISFKEVIILAYGTYDDRPTMVYTVAYEDGPRQNPEGSMVKGTEVFTKNLMIFHATATDKS
jgi:hypothetical protein